ncbi:MAG: tRNA 2-thiouridine(34) synthase MnmA [Phycisphaeraceae bacterium]|nr:tRNA 2-thiouridine(34) synthase MnmA [Phycisphaeraceae bacterium]
MSRTKVVVAMSGGVDSSVAAALLLREGYEVIGCFMRLGSAEAREEAECDIKLHGDGEPGGRGGSIGAPRDAARCASRLAAPTRTSLPQAPRSHKQGCCSVNDAADARLVAAHLGIPFYAVNFERDFGRVMDYFVSEYNAGRTPNPCVRCNDWLKFGRLHALAKDLGAEFVASGHYARVVRGDGSGMTPRSGVGGDAAAALPAAGRARLLRGIDHGKDQSYVLFGTPRERLSEMLLPIGAMTKARVRALASELGLPVSEKPDSQEICFVPDQDYAGFIDRRSPHDLRPGDILDEDGRTIGTHDGHQRFTIGQRRGVPVALGRPVHVIAKDPVANTITVGARERLLRRGCTAAQSNWLIDPPADFIRCTAKVRSTAEPAPARVRAITPDTIEVVFDAPIESVAPGQAVVCYRDDEVIGGGWIEAAT